MKIRQLAFALNTSSNVLGKSALCGTGGTVVDVIAMLPLGETTMRTLDQSQYGSTASDPFA